MVLLTVAAVAAGAGYHYVVTRVDEKIRHHVEAKLRQHYRGLSVSVHSAELIEGEGIEVRGVSIVQPTGEVLHAELAHIDEIFIHCDPNWQDLLAEKIKTERITVRRLKLHAVRQEDRWSIEQLYPLPDFGGGSSPISIQQAAIALVDPERGVDNALVLREVNLSVLPETPAEEAISDAPPRLRINGEIKSDQFQRIVLKGLLDSVLGKWEVRGAVEGLHVSPRVAAKLPIDPAAADMLKGMEALSDFQFHVIGDLKDAAATRFVAKGAVRDGRYQGDRVPYVVTGIAGDFECNNLGWKIENLKAMSGVTTLAGAASATGYDRDADFDLHLVAKQLMLDDRLVELLPEKKANAWREFSPEGTMNVDLRLQRKGGLYFPSAEIDCLDVSFAHVKFPYRLDHASGKVNWKMGRIEVALSAWAGRQEVTLNGTFFQAGEDTTGTVNFATAGPVPIDQKFLSALESNEEAHKAFTAMQPRGSLQLSGTISKLADEEQKYDLHLLVGLHDCSVRYEKFPYPIDQIRGRAEFRDKIWTFTDLEGRNDSGLIRCSGSYHPDGSTQGNGLQLHFDCWNVPLEEELRLALPERMRRAWSDLRPMGSLDHLDVNLHYGSPQPGMSRELSVNVAAVKNAGAREEERGASLSIEPVWFPYRLDNVVGRGKFIDGRIVLEQIRAEHGRTSLSCQGTGEFNERGWAIELSRLNADRLRSDADLLSVLPAELSAFAQRLNVQGPITMAGAFTASGTHARGNSPRLAWDLTFDLEDGSISIGMPVEHIHGGVRLVGGASGPQLVCSGEIAIDSLICQDLQFLDVRGPIWFDRERLLAGGWIPRESKSVPVRKLTASLFGGRFEADCQVMLRGHSPFSIEANLAGADLQRAAAHFSPNLQRITGLAHGKVGLNGDSTGSHTLRGSGSIRLENADIYELPVMLAMLKLLSVKRPDSTAFTDSDIDFRVHGEHIYFDRIDFNGDAVSLKGNGEMDFQRKINLKFYTLVGSDKLRTRLLNSVLGEASKQILMIQVTGSADNPNVKREAFPGINESLQQLFPELAQPRDEEQRPARSAFWGAFGTSRQ